ATDAKSARDFIDVFTSAFGGEKTPESPCGSPEGLSRPHDGELFKTIIDALSRTLNDNDKFFNFVCYEGETPVSIASLCFYDGKGGIYSVGTTPSVRGKGFGTVAIKACIDKWRELKGDELFLQTEAGSTAEKWYQRLGFKIQFTGRFYQRNVKTVADYICDSNDNDGIAK
ncbi:MAG: GNAT family N-acetyltransferase, partial [Defluviitaleaceae bacterium]|nr:GNAT family N-acetyltransferase [Defluviitaleaceae bacterium]